MTQYNIHPLALSPQHYLLARAGFVMAPLWQIEEEGGEEGGVVSIQFFMFPF